MLRGEVDPADPQERPALRFCLGDKVDDPDDETSVPPSLLVKCSAVPAVQVRLDAMIRLRNVEVRSAWTSRSDGVLVESAVCPGLGSRELAVNLPVGQKRKLGIVSLGLLWTLLQGAKAPARSKEWPPFDLGRILSALGALCMRRPCCATYYLLLFLYVIFTPGLQHCSLAQRTWLASPFTATAEAGKTVLVEKTRS